LLFPERAIVGLFHSPLRHVVAREDNMRVQIPTRGAGKNHRGWKWFSPFFRHRIQVWGSQRGRATIPEGWFPPVFGGGENGESVMQASAWKYWWFRSVYSDAQISYFSRPNPDTCCSKAGWRFLQERHFQSAQRLALLTFRNRLTQMRYRAPVLRRYGRCLRSVSLVKPCYRGRRNIGTSGGEEPTCIVPSSSKP
jgi:hypothetical protein